MNRLLSIFCFALLVTSCTYTRPLYSIRTAKYTDTLNHKKIVTKHFIYPTLRRFALIGEGTTTTVFDTSGTKTNQTCTKQIPGFISDGRVRTFTKSTTYRNGNKVQINKTIFQNQGIGGYEVLSTSVFYENGRKIKTVDNLNK